MAEIIQALLPIILLVVTGAVLLRTDFFGQDFRKGMDHFVYWLALPALIVVAITNAKGLGGVGRMVLVFCSATVLVLLLSYAVAAVLRLPSASLGVFVQSSSRGNLAFVGIPVIQLATGGDEQTISQAVLVFAPAVLLYNVLSVIALTLAQHKFDRSAPLRLVKSMAANPLLLACAGGLLMKWFDLSAPGPIESTLRLIGQTAAPLALISLGAAVVTFPIKGHLLPSVASSVLKLAVLPAIVLGLTALLPLPSEQRTIVLILASTPTAVASYVLAVKLGGDPALAAGTITVSTILSAVSLGVALALA